jgi:Tol biopolymer transport system component
VLLVAAALVWRSRSALPPSDLRPVELTSYSGSERSPSFSPDGSKVAFAWNGETGNNFDIYVKQLGAAGAPTRLTTGPETATDPAWSPNDHWIAFMRFQQGKWAIILIPPLGGQERKLAEIPNIPSSPYLSWTPDAKWLAFSDLDSQKALSIWAVDIETGDRRRLTTFATKLAPTTTPLGDSSPSFSPAGRGLAFARQEGSFVWRPFVLRLTADLRPDGEPRAVTSQTYATMPGIAWTANGKDIVFSAGSLLAQSLWRVPVSGQRAPERLPYQFAAMYPAIARTPPRLAYTWNVQNANLWRLDVRTGERKKLIGSSYYSAIPQYSTDGRKIAFQSNRSGNIEVWTCDADGSNCLQLTSFKGAQCGAPSWSPDGRWVALDSRVEGQPEIYVIAADGGAPRRMTNNPADDQMPSWSHDGRWIYFNSDRTGQYEIWKMPKEGGEAVQVTRSGGYWSHESPDGKYLYYNKRWQPGLFRMPAEGAKEEQVLPHVATFGSFGVTSKGVYFVPPPKAGEHPTIQFLETASGKVRTLATLEKGIRDTICVSPNDAYVVWAQPDQNTEDLMLVEGFR